MYADITDKRKKEVEGKDICPSPVRANKSQLKLKWGLERSIINIDCLNEQVYTEYELIVLRCLLMLL